MSTIKLEYSQIVRNKISLTNAIWSRPKKIPCVYIFHILNFIYLYIIYNIIYNICQMFMMALATPFEQNAASSQPSVQICPLLLLKRRNQNPVKLLRWSILQKYLTTLIIFAKRFILDVLQGCEYATTSPHIFL